ncbi:MAG: stearoyl-CoA desaturase (delta-9 desaturase) [Pseudohongiellaceae bacterium]|jgi:stearoyl-CoA desaturase (delta-9 desaturase)
MKKEITSNTLHESRGRTLLAWIDADAVSIDDSNPKHINWLRCVPFIFLHVACLGVFWVGWSPAAIIACLGFFWLRMFAITAFYHRLFAHRTYKTNRVWQFLFAVLGNSSCQRGPLWWAAHHRKHHKHADKPEDLHSPIQHGFWFSHVGWFLSDGGYKTDYTVIKDLVKFPELKFLNRFDILVPAISALLVFALGEYLLVAYPHLETNGWQLLVWGFFISTCLLFHATFTINSLGHLLGSRRFETKDDSRNNPWFALLTLGEGWHNNHHRFAVSTRQGFYWWELDITYYLLKIMCVIGIVRDLNPVPKHVLNEGLGKVNKPIVTEN